MEPGFPYKLEDGGKIPNQSRHTQNAVQMSNAIYQKNPSEYLNACSSDHTIHTVCDVSQHSDKDVLYNAFKGPNHGTQAMTDLDIQLRHKDDTPGGTFHSGFEKRSRVNPLGQVVYCAELEKCETMCSAVIPLEEQLLLSVPSPSCYS